MKYLMGKFQQGLVNSIDRLDILIILWYVITGDLVIQVQKEKGAKIDATQGKNISKIKFKMSNFETSLIRDIKYDSPSTWEEKVFITIDL